MGIGTGVGFFAAGAILYWAVEVDVPFIDDDALGAILMIVGALAVVLAVVVNTQRAHTSIGTDIGSGIALLAAGAVLFWAVDIDLPYVFDDALGVILMLGGLISIIATVAMNAQRQRSRSVVDRRY